MSTGLGGRCSSHLAWLTLSAPERISAGSAQLEAVLDRELLRQADLPGHRLGCHRWGHLDAMLGLHMLLEPGGPVAGPIASSSATLPESLIARPDAAA